MTPELLLGSRPTAVMKAATTPRAASVAGILIACALLAQPLGGGAEDWLPLANPPDAGYRIAELRTFAADQCTAPVPRAKDAQLVMWVNAKDELPYVEQWVRDGACGRRGRGGGGGNAVKHSNGVRNLSPTALALSHRSTASLRACAPTPNPPFRISTSALTSTCGYPAFPPQKQDHAPAGCE
jgi:hypothetical protein